MATIKDIAERTGVTPTTVSRVVNNRGYVSEKTRAKVEQAMKELDYQPNALARALVISILGDNYYGGRLAARHLIEKGCKNLMFFGGRVCAGLQKKQTKMLTF